MELSEGIMWAARRSDGILITIRKDGRPQSSDISYAVVEEGVFSISLTMDRAKTKNMMRDPRVVLHVTDRPSWSYLSFDGIVELTPPTTAPDDATSHALVDYYRRVAGEDHPNWDEYRAAMIEEKRLLALFTPTSVVGQIH